MILSTFLKYHKEYTTIIKDHIFQGILITKIIEPVGEDMIYDEPPGTLGISRFLREAYYRTTNPKAILTLKWLESFETLTKTKGVINEEMVPNKKYPFITLEKEEKIKFAVFNTESHIPLQKELNIIISHSEKYIKKRECAKSSSRISNSFSDFALFDNSQS